MRIIRWNLAASIGLIVLSQAASAAPEDGVTAIAGRAAADVSRYFDGTIRLAQAGGSPATPTPATPAPAESKASDAPKGPDKGPDAPKASDASSPGTVSGSAIKSGPSVPGCALRYLAAEIAGKLKGRKWKQFRQEECGASEVTAVFPTSIAPKYANEKPDKAMTLTCADQFNANKANKAADANGGLKWIEKSGGYYSECIVRLKG